MANKRILKKQVRMACGDIASECILSATFIKDVDVEALRNLVIKTAMLQEQTLEKIDVAFEKVPRDFANAHDYHKARRAYFSKAYTSLKDSFNKSLMDLVNEMNKALQTK